MNITQLAPSVDSLFVMAYDMGFGNLSGRAAPNAPLNGWTYNDTTSVRQYIAKATASKVILGVPYFGYKYSTSGNLPYATTSGGAVADTYAGIADDFSCALQLSRNWDTTASSPWASWWSPASGDPCAGNHNSWRELYYDDATSLMAKYDLVNSSDLQGTGMWALGYDGTSPDLWRALAAKLRASWAATFDTSAVPLSWAVNQTRTITIGLTNVGNSTWPAGGNNPVRLGLHFMVPGSTGWLTDQRIALPADVPPGQSVTLTASVSAPSGTNAGVLQAQMVKEQQLWFKQWAIVPVTMQGPIWMAGYDASAIPRTWTDGQTQNFTVTVTNSGNQTWPSAGPYPVRLGLHFAPVDRAGSAAWLTDQRFALPNDLAPGQSATINVTVTAPASRAAAVLEAQMVREQQFWFFQTGPMSVTDAAPAWDASYDLSQVPHQWTPGQTQTVAVAVTNTGNQTWPAGGSNPVHLGLHFAAGPGQPYAGWLTDQRVTLPADLPPGQSVTVNAALTSPAAGASVLEAQMVKEQQFWFVPAGAASIETGSPGWLAGYDLTGVPRNWVAGQAQTVSLTVTNTLRVAQRPAGLASRGPAARPVGHAISDTGRPAHVGRRHPRGPDGQGAAVLVRPAWPGGGDQCGRHLDGRIRPQPDACHLDAGADADLYRNGAQRGQPGLAQRRPEPGPPRRALRRQRGSALHRLVDGSTIRPGGRSPPGSDRAAQCDRQRPRRQHGRRARSRGGQGIAILVRAAGAAVLPRLLSGLSRAADA